MQKNDLELTVLKLKTKRQFSKVKNDRFFLLEKTIVFDKK